MGFKVPLKQSVNLWSRSGNRLNVTLKSSEEVGFQQLKSVPSVCQQLLVPSSSTEQVLPSREISFYFVLPRSIQGVWQQHLFKQSHR